MRKINREKEQGACAVTVAVCAVGIIVALVVAFMIEIMKK